MRLIQITGIFSLFLILVLTSCNETSKPVKSDPFFDKLKEGKATSEELDSLLDANGVEGSYDLKVPKAHFEITFPVRKVHVKESRSIQIIDGLKKMTYHYTANMQKKNDVNLAYQVDYNYFDDVKTDQDIEELFNGQRDYWISSTNSVLEKEEVIDSNGVLGRDIYLTVDGSDIKVSIKMYYSNGVFYRMSVVTPEGNLFNKSISKFLDSFKILNK